MITQCVNGVKALVTEAGAYICDMSPGTEVTIIDASYLGSVEFEGERNGRKSIGYLQCPSKTDKVGAQAQLTFIQPEN